ncbi:phosphoglucomutase [Clostridium thermosuccinogenes]|jgi:phosphoglucomutase|uniref:Phosphoglucomutase n=1 Tax=Clostridium thermosuccinogenes TaxID=84032 RepID=A0A2K2FKQ7_9CLOT|nr:phospho-sugar mutase [Pseudoclostridium thermosuccinogenes]AUS95973.1 phosphoglucomutase [Pseudoclostridium thermosuccinogenes]PNT99362.1 phosphoglucomutase [Pseudoclostridium thermosuccinogenes]PNU01049.1 phosphoglucomutase [Pseudoclostridium thermosuccinogenes]
MDAYEKFRFWLENEYFDEETRRELDEIKDNPKEIEERFYKDLEFGTGGLRGIIGAGTNRINVYTVRKASQGVANYISQKGEEAKKKGIVIAYDSRHKSPELALETAKVFAGNGIKAYLFDELRPTPELSFAVRELKASAGIVITASHNPKQYNGYKVYGEDGGQLPLEGSNAVLKEIDSIEDITKVTFMEKDEALEKGLIEIIGSQVDDSYISKLKTLSINPEIVKEVGKDFRIIYTPLHGTGNKPVRRILNETGFKNVLVVKEQELPDPDFSTVKSPNPEEKAAFALAIELAKKENVDLIIGTDPDCDRVGVVVRNAVGEYVVLTGNQTGCLLLEYILSQKKAKGELPPNGFVVKTIVTTELARKIADNYNVELVEVLTGFKFIGEQIKLLDEQGDKKYLFGFEESYGYLAGTFARDKDAVVASMLIAEMAAYYKSRNMSLYEGLQEIFEKYGYSLEGLTTFTLEGKSGLEKIKYTMNKLRTEEISKFGNFEAKAIRDYQEGYRYDIANNRKERLSLPQSDVLYYEISDGSWFCIRPSGTEPKIKIYYGVSESSLELSEKKLNELQDSVLSVVKEMLY